ncbi:MAG: hypothetical protein ACLFPS_09150 [Clostridia bacterium]
MLEKNYEFLAGRDIRESHETWLVCDDEVIGRIFLEYSDPVKVRVLITGKILTSNYQDIKKRILQRYIPAYHEADKIVFEFYCLIHEEDHHSCCNYL